MGFLLLLLFALLLAVDAVRSRRLEDPAALRGTLLAGGSGFLAIKLLGTGLLGPGGPLGVPMAIGASTLVVLYLVWAVPALVLWLALSRLAFHRLRTKDYLTIVPSAGLAMAFAASPGIHPFFAALAALPAVVRARWRHELSAGSIALVALVGFLFALLHFVPIPLHGVVAHDVQLLTDAARFAGWMETLSVLYLLAVLPRLVWGMNVQIRNVKLRLLVSHLLMGLVPLLLVFVFWGLSTYLSVNAERAQIAARHLEEEANELAKTLEQAARAGGELERLDDAASAESELGHWARLHAAARPGLRAFVRVTQVDGSIGPWMRLHGDHLAAEETLFAWPDSLRQQGILIVDGTAMIGARRAGGAANAIMVVIPMGTALGPDLERRLGAETFLETRFAFGEEPDADVDPPLAGSEAMGVIGTPPGRGAGKVSVEPAAQTAMGAAVVNALVGTRGHWEREHRLVWARVGFWSALQSLSSNLQENQFNWIPLLFLAGVAVLFVLVEFMTVGMVVSMGSSITRALGALSRGTTRLREGNLRYRIPIEGRDDLWEVAENFNQMAQDLEKARELEIEKERLEGELSLAREIQSRLLPADVPALPRTELAGVSVPARQVGGDYFDYLPFSDGRVALIVADVSGKGVPAALLMSSFRAALLSQRIEERSPSMLMERLNRFLHRSVEPGRFVTAVLAVFDPSTGQLVYSNAGHNPPYWMRPNGRYTALREGGLVLGLFQESVYAEERVQLEEGDLVALFTDGVTEAQNEFEEFWGEERLIDILRMQGSKSCRRLVSEILEDVRDFSGDQGQTDDLTLLFLRWRGGTGVSA